MKTDHIINFQVQVLNKKKLFSKNKFALVVARFNEDITSKLHQGALEAFKDLHVNKSQLIEVSVPGAFEIPFAIKNLFLNKSVNAAVAIGAVIKGETSHYKYICKSVERGCSLVQLELNKPIGFAVLTTLDHNQALNRAGGSKGNKGYEATMTVAEMLYWQKKFKKSKI